MKPQTGFLLITTAVVVLGLASLTLVGALQYQADRNSHRGVFISNDHVENFPWSLLPEDKQ